jgi:hypothetical protein
MPITEIPMRLLIRTKPGSWVSYSGSLRRTWSKTTALRTGPDPLAGHLLMVVAIGVLWLAITAMYLAIIYVLGVYSAILIPFWLIRWADRAREFSREREDAALRDSMTG